MSTPVVSKAQIDYILTAVKDFEVGSPSWHPYLTLDGIGDVLWQENQRSVNRYSENNDAVPGYVYQQTKEPISPVQALKFIQCLMCQSCEMPDGELTEAAALLDRLQIDVIGCLPGYEEAAWSI